MKSFSLLAACLLSLAAFTLQAQEKAPIKFGKISAADFDVKSKTDSGASAIIIADIGSTSLEGNVKGGISVIFQRITRIKIVDKQGFEASEISIPLFASSNGNEQKLEDLKANTYNLENGQVVATKLESSAIFKNKLSKEFTETKFTLPAVKAGSVIEYSYTIRSDFYHNLHSWNFQSGYPCLYNSFQVDIPYFMNYVTISQGYISPELKTSTYKGHYRFTLSNGAARPRTLNEDAEVTSRQWIARDVPALKEESYTSSINNFMAGVRFQLASIRFDGELPDDYLGDWVQLGQELMKDERFGASLSKGNGWLDDDLKLAVAGATSRLEKAKRIFAYLRDHITCTDHSASMMESGLKDAWKKHSGNVAEINLMLVAMLHHEKIDADPIALSTRPNGFTNELYPLWSKFNYVICRARIDGISYDLDASSPYNGFGRLSTACYNGHARIITTEAAMPVYFDADSLKEQKLTSVIISNDEKAGLSGSFKSDLGYYESLDMREELKGETGGFFKKIKTSYGYDVNLVDPGIDSLKQPDMPATVHYDFTFKPNADENVWYFNPMTTEGYKENPFKSADRRYPVEMPFTTDETYILNMEVPKGWVVEEVPKSVKFAFNTDEGYFEYLVQKSDDAIMLRSRIKLTKANFAPDDYQGLREFFAFIVKKQAESIVFKKKA